MKASPHRVRRGVTHGRTRLDEAPVSIRKDAVIGNLLKRMSRDEETSFKDTQLKALKRALEAREKKHTVDLRGRIPFFNRSFYFVLLAGKDRRRPTSAERAVVDGVQAAVFVATTTAVMICFFYWLYLIKSALGIDMHPDLSLHLYKP